MSAGCGRRARAGGGGVDGGYKDSESLLSQKGSPAGFENVVPALGGVSKVRSDNCDSPTKVMGGIHPRSDGLVHVLGVEPSRELLIFRHTTFEAPGEAS